MTDVSNSTPVVRTEQVGHVAVIWLEDEKRRNALSTKLVGEVISALRASRHEGARAVVLASRQKAFCAGADIRDMLDNGWLDSIEKVDSVVTPPELFEAIDSDPRLVLAAVDGPALGGGVELCLVCDLVVAGDAASFMFPELGLGVLPTTAVALLPQLIGRRAAADLIYTRRRIDTHEAFRLGIVSALSSGEAAVDHAVRMAEAICIGSPPRVLRAAKRGFAQRPDWIGIRGLLGAMDPLEWREGTSAFVNKRRPEYDQFWDTDAKAPSRT